LFPGADKKGVMLFSKKGDALRFSFTDDNGGSRILPPFEGISLFKALPNESPFPVTDNFYSLYEKTKAHSGVISEKTSRSKNVIDLTNKINLLKKQLTAVPESGNAVAYLDGLRKVSGELESLPLYYIRQLLDVDIKDAAATITEFKKWVSEGYINTILEKDEKILNETETVLLSEQFL
jgi:hypothetical protein